MFVLRKQEASRGALGDVWPKCSAILGNHRYLLDLSLKNTLEQSLDFLGTLNLKAQEWTFCFSS